MSVWVSKQLQGFKGAAITIAFTEGPEADTVIAVVVQGEFHPWSAGTNLASAKLEGASWSKLREALGDAPTVWKERGQEYVKT